MKNVKSKGKAAIQKCKSFGIIEGHIADPFILPKLNFFLSVAKTITLISDSISNHDFVPEGRLSTDDTEVNEKLHLR